MNVDTSWFSQAVNWVDKQGKLAWIALMVIGFVMFWPIGLVILAYLIWSKRMFANTFGRCAKSSRSTTGNTAFDSYKQETLKRLEKEEEDFRAFLQRLRDAKDQAEFEQFLNERSQKA